METEEEIDNWYQEAKAALVATFQHDVGTKDAEQEYKKNIAALRAKYLKKIEALHRKKPTWKRLIDTYILRK